MELVKAPILLRVASIVSLVFAGGHSLGGTQSWSPPGETEVLRAMRTFRFDVEGVSRTYWDFYFGFGLSISVFLLAQAVVLWQLAAVSKKDPVLVRPIIAIFFLSAVANAILSQRFFFTVPLALGMTIAVCLGLAFVAVRRSTRIA